MWEEFLSFEVDLESHTRGGKCCRDLLEGKTEAS